MGKSTGRKPKLTPEVQEKIVGFIRINSKEIAAAEAAGVGKSTYMAWKAKGEKAASGPYREFLDAVTRAKAEAEVRNVGIVQRAGNGVESVRRVVRTEEIRDAATNALVAHRTVTEETTVREYDWRASAWLLERSHGWNKTEKHEVTGKDGEPLPPSTVVNPVQFYIPSNGRDEAPAPDDRPAEAA